MLEFILPIVIFVILWIIVVKAFKINLKPFKSKLFPLEVYPTKREIRYSLGMLLFFALVLFSSIFENKPLGINMPVEETNFASKFFDKDSVRPVIARYNLVEIRGLPYLTHKEPGFGLKVIAALADRKNNLIDSAFFLFLTIFLVIGFWNFDFKNPFKIKISRTVYLIGFAFIIYSIVSILSYTAINRVIKKITNDIYKYDAGFSLFNLFKFFIGIILLRLGQIFRNAEKLQQEQDLTV